MGAGLLAATLIVGASAQFSPAAAAGAGEQKPQGLNASEVGPRRHHRYANRPQYPYPMYYGRPVYYAPAPFLPIPPLWGYGWEWW